MIAFIAILDGSDDVWGVRVPDMPGCHGGGATPESAIADATSALRELAADGVAIRLPRALRDIVADPSVNFDPATEALVVLEIEAIGTPQALANA